MSSRIVVFCVCTVAVLVASMAWKAGWFDGERSPGSAGLQPESEPTLLVYEDPEPRRFEILEPKKIDAAALVALVERARGIEPVDIDMARDVLSRFSEFVRTSTPNDLSAEALEMLSDGCVDLAVAAFGDGARHNVRALEAEAWSARGDLDRAVERLRAVPRDRGALTQSSGEYLARIELRRDRPEAALRIVNDLEQVCDPGDLEGLQRIEMVRSEAYSLEGKLSAAALALDRAGRLANQRGSDVDTTTWTLQRVVSAVLSGRAARGQRELAKIVESQRVQNKGLLRGDAALIDLCAGTIALVEEQRVVRRPGEPVRRRSVKLIERSVHTGLGSIHLEQEAMLRLLEIALIDGVLSSARKVVSELESGPIEEAPLEIRMKYRALVGRLAIASGQDVVSLQGAARALEHTASELMERVEANLSAPGGKGWLHVDDRRLALSDLVELELAIGRAEHEEGAGLRRALNHLLRAQWVNSIARHRGALPITVADFERDVLSARRCALVYLVSKAGSHLFVCGGDAQFSHHDLPPGPLLSGAVRAFASALRRPGKALTWNRSQADSVVSAGQRVSAMLLPPEAIKALRGCDECVVCGGEMLSRLPFGALPMEGDGNEGLALLGESVALCETESLPLYADLERRSQASRRRDPRLALFANTLGGSAVDGGIESVAFPASEPGVRQLSEVYGAVSSLTYFDERCTRAAFESLDLEAIDVLHLIAHDVTDTGSALGAGVALFDGVLRYPDLDSRTTHGVLILGACNAGSSPRRFGDSPVATNLGGAWLRGGGNSVVLSQAAVELREHLSLCATVHPALARGQSPGAALLAARQARRSGSTARRFRDAQYQLFGAGL